MSDNNDKDKERNTAVVILAAGASSRFEGCKMLAKVNDKTLLQIAIEKARHCVGEHVYLVTGGWQKEIEQQLKHYGLSAKKCIHNPNWQQGLGHSIAAAVTTLQAHYSYLLIMAGDQIALTSQNLKKMMTQASPERIVAAHYQGQPGIPALFPKVFFPQLMALSSDKGAKSLLIKNPDAIIAIDNPDAAIDIDKRQDLEHWLAEH